MNLQHREPVFLAHISADRTRSQTVQEHLQGTAQLAAQFARPFHAEEQARLSGLLHDIGKYTAGFQRRLHGGQKVDHSTAGMQQALALRQTEAAFAIAGHHGGLPDGGAKTDDASASTLLGRSKRPLPEDCSRWRQEIQPPPATRPPRLPQDNFSESFYIRMLFSCLVDADYQDTQTFMEGAVPRGGYATPAELLEKLHRYIQPWWEAQTELNRRRCQILRTCLDAGPACAGGLYTLTVPTGGGKTVASLAFALTHAVAHGKDRIIYVIPYTSIIDQTAEVFQKILGPENVVEHHAGVETSVPEDNADPAMYRKALATENWDAPVIVTTAVQFFESLYGNGPARCRKLHNIANSVVVFDEAQTLPVPHLRPCVAAIGQLVQYYGVTAVLCTATQPALQPLFAELAPGLTLRELCPDTAGMEPVFRRTTLVMAGELSTETLIAQLNAAPQALCVVNRRATAQKVYATLAEEGRYCLTTLLCPADRKRLLREIRARLQLGLPCRVVSTSLIEAGVDLDFPAVWREEAGLDSILQAAGRCNREGKRAAADSPVTVFRLQGQRVPAMILPNVDAARHVFDTFPAPTQPEAIEAYFTFFRAVLGDAALDRNQILDAFRHGIEGRMLPFATVANQFHLIDSPIIAVYLPVEEGAALVDALRTGQSNRALYRRLGQYAVNVYPEHLQRLQAVGALETAPDGSYIVNDLSLYDRSTGLSLDVEAGQAWFA